ncbi:hypothetical protein Bca101_026840 [Brassica carinata]
MFLCDFIGNSDLISVKINYFYLCVFKYEEDGNKIFLDGLLEQFEVDGNAIFEEFTKKMVQKRGKRKVDVMREMEQHAQEQEPEDISSTASTATQT